MARRFSGADQYLRRDPTPVEGTTPFTMACWFRSEVDTEHDVLMSTASPDVGAFKYHTLRLKGHEVGDLVAAQSSVGAVQAIATTTTGFTINTWHHACGVWAAVDDRRVYIDGGSKGTDNTNRLCTNLTLFSIGTLWRADAPTVVLSFQGRIAEAAVWDATLTDAEAAVLGAGYCPLFVRPQSLIAYWPLIRDEDLDRVGTYNLTPINAPTIEAHPPILYPAATLAGQPAAPLGVVAAPMKGWGWGWVGA